VNYLAHKERWASIRVVGIRRSVIRQYPAGGEFCSPRKVVLRSVSSAVTWLLTAGSPEKADSPGAARGTTSQQRTARIVVRFRPKGLKGERLERRRPGTPVTETRTTRRRDARVSGEPAVRRCRCPVCGSTAVDGVAVAVLSRVTQSRELAYATDDVAQQLDELQYTIGEGPCFDAYLDDHPQFYPPLQGPAMRRAGQLLPLTQHNWGCTRCSPSPCQTVSDRWASWSCTGEPPAASPTPNTTRRQPARPRSQHGCRPTGKHVYRSRAARPVHSKPS
jgi:hypothetical protein